VSPGPHTAQDIATSGSCSKLFQRRGTQNWFFRLDFAEEGGKNKLLAVGVVEGKVAVALLEASKFGGKHGQCCTVVARGFARGGGHDNPPDKGQFRIFCLERELKVLIELWAVAVVEHDLGSANMRFSNSGISGSGGQVLAPGACGDATCLVFLVICGVDLDFDERVDVVVPAHGMQARELLGGNDVD